MPAPQSEDDATRWRGVSSGWQAFTFTRAKQECGTKPASNQKMSKFWALRRGSPRVLLCWEPLSGALSSSLESCKQELRRNAGLQCGWQILLQSANPRANHTLRTLPPSFSAEYGRQHDEGVWNTAITLLGQLPRTPQNIAGRVGIAFGGKGRRCCLLGFMGGR